MAKKFFYDKVYNSRKKIINLVIVGFCVIGIIICFIITSNFSGRNLENPGGELNLKSNVTTEINEKLTTEMFFSKIENVDLSKIKITYPEDFDISKTGKYNIKLEIDGKTYTSQLEIVDTIIPELILKNVTITEGNEYNALSFVEKCTDNSNHECDIDFYQLGVDEEGNNIDYSKYTKSGTYQIKISAKDESGNQSIQEAVLIINKKGSNKPIETTPVCKYGNGEYDQEKYLATLNITSNNCAISLDLYDDDEIMSEINKIMERETTKIKKDVEALNLTGTLALNRLITAIVNKTGDGIVGYELKMTVTITDNNNEVSPVIEYKLDSNGKRVFINNPYNLAS